MRISYRWLKEHGRCARRTSDLVAEFVRTGTEVEAVEKVGADLTNVVTAQVVSKKPHPDSDHMWLCQVSVGDRNVDADGPFRCRCVCGARRIRGGRPHRYGGSARSASDFKDRKASCAASESWA